MIDNDRFMKSANKTNSIQSKSPQHEKRMKKRKSKDLFQLLIVFCSRVYYSERLDQSQSKMPEASETPLDSFKWFACGKK